MIAVRKMACVLLTITIVDFAAAQTTTPANPGHQARENGQPMQLNSAGVFGRGDRYGEVVLIRRNGFKLEGEVWATAGMNDCPAEQWQALRPEVIRGETGAMAVLLNGPRYFLPNSVASTKNDRQRRKFGDLQMQRVASVQIDPRQAGRHYVERTVKRTTTFVFHRGEEIYQLKSPQGDVYVMQSMSQIVDPSLSMKDLSGLAMRLNLPRGWTYEAITLDEDLHLVANGAAVVLQDDLSNTYQRR